MYIYIYKCIYIHTYVTSLPILIHIDIAHIHIHKTTQLTHIHTHSQGHPQFLNRKPPPTRRAITLK